MRRRGLIQTMILLTAAALLSAGVAQGVIYPNTVLHDGPSAYWRLDETSFGGAGDAVDAAGTKHGTYTNTSAITLAQAGPRPGDGFLGFESTNYSPSFATSGDGNVTMPAGFLPTGDSARTFTGWFNGTDSTKQNWLNYGYNDTGQRVSISAGPTRVAVAVCGHNYGIDGLGLGAGWHHIGIILPGGTGAESDDWQFVIDGVDRTAEAGTVAGAGSTTTIDTQDTADRRIGVDVGGRIDEVAVFDRALSIAEVQRQFNAAQGNYSITDFGFQTAAKNGESPATSGTVNFPSGTLLYVRERLDSETSQQVRAFLKFDLDSMVDEPIISATLKLHEFDKLNNNSEELFIAKVIEDWDPTTNKPTFGQLIDGSSEFSFGNNGVGERTVDIDFEIDVTEIVRQWQADPLSNYGFRLRIDDNYVGAAFDHAGDDAPVLFIKHVPEPATWILLILGGLSLIVLRRRTRRAG